MNPSPVSHMGSISFRIIISTIVSLFALLPLKAQIITKGDKPFGATTKRTTRSAYFLPTSRLGRFDKDSALIATKRENEAYQSLRKMVFAHKQIVDIDIIKQGLHSQEDGYDVWRYRITSRGAKSLNFYFTAFQLPEGGKLSVYATDNPGNFIGPFNDLNNNSHQTLPTELVYSDDVVIEVAAPIGNGTPQLRLGEVNHGIIQVLSEYSEDARFSCSPQVSCFTDIEDVARSVVLLIIDGRIMGTGTLLNNLKQDRTPYIYTAAHVLNLNFTRKDHKVRAQKTVAIFNYASKICGVSIQPPVGQTLAGATLVEIDEGTDACLLKMNQTPPDTYNASYAGWDLRKEQTGPFRNIHHPKGVSKRMNLSNATKLEYTNFDDSRYPFKAKVFYQLPRWEIGSTHFGSSGSPLLNDKKLVIGALTGGSSTCHTQLSDYFSSLYQLSINKESTSAKKILEALRGGDPSSEAVECPLLDNQDPEKQPKRVTHMPKFSDSSNILYELKPLPDNQITSKNEVAEYYIFPKESQITGVSLSIHIKKARSNPAPLPPIKLNLYKGNPSHRASIIQSIDLPMENFNISNSDAILREVYVPLKYPIITQDGSGYFFALNTSSFTEEVIIASHTGKGLKGAMGGEDGVFTALKTENAVLWIDPIVIFPEKQNNTLVEENTPPVRLIQSSNGQFLLIFAPHLLTAQGNQGTIDIYTLTGQPIFHKSLNGYSDYIPRKDLEGLGILVLKIDINGHPLGMKILINP